MKTVRQTPQAINKPMLILGVERTILAVVMVFCVVIAAKVDRLLGIGLFVAGCYLAKRVTRQDADRLKIARQEWRLSPIYDAVKRSVK